MFYKESTDFYGSYNITVNYGDDVSAYDIIDDMNIVAKQTNMGFTPVDGMNTVYSDFSDISQVTSEILKEANDIDAFLDLYRNRYNKHTKNSKNIAKPILVWSNPNAPTKTTANRNFYLVK